MMKSTSHSKPRLLMLSHCLPEPCGDGHSARAWQLLKLAQSSHQVDLACMTEAAVNLKQWRTTAAMTHRLSMDAASPHQRLMRHVVGLINQPAAAQWRWLDTLGHNIGSWTSQQSYDAVICTHPALWQLARTVDAPQRLCDMDGGAFSTFDFVHANDIPPALPWHAKRILRQHQSMYRSVTDECDVITTSHASLCDQLSANTNQTFHLPRAVDLSWFNADNVDSQQQDHSLTPTLMLHADERQRSGKAKWDWFSRHVWQKVQQAVPNAQWARPISAAGSTLDSLRSASVIVSPQDDPGAGQWAALQSMAMSRMVIAAGPGVSEMGVRHGEHLLMCQKPGDWVELCVESLRSASVRMKLAKAGRAFVESHCPAIPPRNLLSLHRLPNAHALDASHIATDLPLAMAA